jgi:HAD superfamily hydrolase (TIGR01459 family)
MTLPAPTIPLIPSMAPLAPRFDAWICDVWGVLHNGVKAFGPAVEACSRFRQQSGTVLLLTNAPRPASAVQLQLDGFGVPRDCYDVIVTSGDLTRRLISDQPDRRLLHVGPDRDLGIFAGLDLNFVGDADADVVICTGLLNDNVETPAHYTSRFAPLVERRVSMICANPDLTVERGERLVYCAGSLAAEYERLGGSVVYAGKPHPPIYELAFEQLAAVRGGPVPHDRILAIGDGLRTDIKGAGNVGLAAAFIASGVHVSGPLDEPTLAALFAGSDTHPIAALPALAW